MSFPRYSTYRDTGVEWIGKVPAHWSVVATKRVFDIVGGSTPSSDAPDFWDGEVPWVTPADLSRLESLEIRESLRSITEAGVASCSTTISPAGSIILSTRAPIGSLAISTRPMCTNQGCKTLVPSAGVLPRYFAYLLGIATTPLNLRGKGTTFLELSGDELGRFPVPAPPSSEQAAIAVFLDSETAKIDGLVAEQRRLIDLLQEKRQAVISHAVTKGLNPHAPMKDSGVEWLGEVPAHWRVGKVGFYMRVLSGFAFPSSGFSECPTDTRLLRGVNVSVSRIRWDETVYWPRAEGDGLDDYVLKAGDLVIGMDRPLISEGMRVATISPEDEPCLLLQRVARLEPHPTMNTHFLKLLMASPMFIAHFTPDTTGVSVPHISPDQIKSFVAPVPPRQEQDEIVDHVHELGGQYDALIQAASEKIDLLQERRAGLITAAVTGQIDVRGLAAAEAA